MNKRKRERERERERERSMRKDTVKDVQRQTQVEIDDKET